MAKHTDKNRNIETTYTVEEGGGNPLLEDGFLPPAPLHLDYATRQFWDSVILSLPYDWFITADLALFELYCITYVQYHEFSGKAKGNEVYEDEKGVLRTNPYHTMAEKARTTLLAMTGKLKFNVKSRDGDTIKASRVEASKKTAIERSGRRKGLMFIPGGKKD
jgi:phage terminase small subunit